MKQASVVLSHSWFRMRSIVSRSIVKKAAEVE